MALKRDFVAKRIPGLFELIGLEREKINLKPLSKVTVQFDPFSNNSKDTRLFNFFLNSEITIKTNPKCIIKTEILTDRSDPQVIFNLVSGNQLIFKSAHLKCLEIFQLMNEHITPLAPKEEPVTHFPEKALRKK